MCVGGDGCVRVPISLCVCVCVQVCVCFFQCHRRKRAWILYILYVVEATMGRRTSRWSP